MNIYRLEFREYPELLKIADGIAPDPASSVAIVARDENGPAGRIFLIAPVHVEGIWVREDLRGNGLWRELVDRAEYEAKKLNLKTLCAYGVSEEMNHLIERCGYERTPLVVWRKEL